MKTKQCAGCGATSTLNKHDNRTQIRAIIRTQDVCRDCFEIIKLDNKKIILVGGNIPNRIFIVRRL